jgi:hypothetical protein
MHTRDALLSAALLGCASATPPPAPPPQTTATMNVQMSVRVNCESICRNIENACRQSCPPRVWSPQMQAQQDACERDCDFNRFSCVHDCQGR